ncbi:MAG: hypothetical protein MJY82_10410 [Fibrobacter sp.]|nr:hypothetical protein [Fibrobacter sp.]
MNFCSMVKFSSVALLSASFLAACDAGKTETTKSVIVYYSQQGHTKTLVDLFQQKTHADVVKLEMVKDYPEEYNATIEAVRAEKAAGTFPELKNAKVDLSKYDTVYVGYPIWFGTFAPPIHTFLDSTDLSGKVVVNFCNFGSGGRKASTFDLHALEPNAKIVGSYGITQKRLNAGFASGEIDGFLAGLGAGSNDIIAGSNGVASNVAPAEVPAGAPAAGAYTKFRPLASEDSAAFIEATKDYGYLHLEPESVSTQIVAGLNYLFICTATEPTGAKVKKEMRVFRPLPGRGDIQMLNVENAD